MNRTIKFRGKCSPQSKYKDEWVTGSLVVPEQIQDNEVLIVVAHSDNCKITYHVDKNTVGQFTDKCDMNGKVIYEGDILVVKDSPEICVIVEWNDAHDAMCTRFKGEEKCGCTTLGEMLHLLKWIVVGNIYDNPELIMED